MPTLWAALAETGRAVEVVVVGRDLERLAAAGRVLDRWRSTPAAAPEPEAVAEMDSIRQAVARGDWVALEVYGDLNGVLRRMRDLSAAATGRPAIMSGRIWRLMRVPA